MAASGARVCTWYIRHVDVFRPLSTRSTTDLVRSLPRRRFTRGESIISADTLPEKLFVVRQGTVRLFHQVAGVETTVERLSAGQLFGVTGLLGSDQAGLYARAETPVELCVIEGGQLLETILRWPELVLEITARLGVRLRHDAVLSGSMTSSGARARLARALHQRAVSASEVLPGGGTRLRGVPRHVDLADEIGATRETVTRLLAQLEHDGYIQRYGRQIVVPDVARLAEHIDAAT